VGDPAIIEPILFREHSQFHQVLGGPKPIR